VFIGAFFDAVFGVVRGGLLRYYEEQEEDLTVVRGRIISSRQFSANANRPDVVSCRFDELTYDNVWNRVLKAAIRLVRPWITSVDLHRRWAELMLVFDDIQAIDVGTIRFERLTFDRRAMRYRTAIYWARWIISVLSPSVRAGERRAPGLLFDMNALFQAAVASVLRKRISYDDSLTLHTQEGSVWLAGIAGAEQDRAFRLRPDLVLRRNGEVIAIADTKWKIVEVGDTGYLMPLEGDIYQVHAYAQAYGADRLALIYPSNEAVRAAKATSFQLPGSAVLRPLVEIVTVDVTADRFDLVGGDSTAGVAEYFGASPSVADRAPEMLSTA
jgi:5-methylcytosine-specific restriction enzyme subunit McrC